MEITETRKKIIELIEPYMDKTLSEGCLISTEDGLIKLNDSNLNIIYKGTENEVYYYKYKKNIKEIQKEDILGNYDITAVLEYIFEKKQSKVTRIIYGDIEIWYDGYFEFIPNKPLYLYTEQEDKELYETLLKLK